MGARVLFFGTDQWSRVALRALHKSPLVSHLGVVCPVAKAVGRGRKLQSGVVRLYAEEHGIKIFDAPTTNRLRPKIEEWQPGVEEIAKDYDVGVVFSFGYFLPGELLRAFPKCALNIHPSLLPKYRGASPIQASLINGDQETGVSIILVDPDKFDKGDILRQDRVSIGEHECTKELAMRLSTLGADMMLDVIENFGTYHENRVVQSKSGGKLARKIKPTDRLIDFSKFTSREVYNRWRALDQLYCYLNSKRVILRKLMPVDLNKPRNVNEPGTVIIENKTSLYVLCKDDTYIHCQELQLEGKKPVSDTTFINGHCHNKTKIYIFEPSIMS